MKTQQFSWNAPAGLWLVLLAIGLAWGCSQRNPPQPPTSKTQPQAIPSHAAPTGRVTFQAPAEWRFEHPTSRMRMAQYDLPRAKGDAEDAELIVYYFGPGQGGSVEANVVRWINQMEQPDGSPSSKKAVTKTLTVHGLEVTLLDVTGTYRAEMMPGQGARFNKPNFRLRAAVVESPQGPYFVKLVGPEKTVSRWDKSFMEFIESAQFK